MINKPVIISIASFLIVSAAFCCIKPPTSTRVNFSNKDIALNSTSNKSAQSVNFSNVDSVNSRSRTIQNKNLAFNTKNNEINYNNVNYINTDKSINNKGLFSHNNNSMSTNSSVENQGLVSYNRNNMSTDKAINNQDVFSRNKNNLNEADLSKNNMKKRYIMERDIDWATWRSNVVNLVLEKSYDVKELEKYEVMTWFYYKFKVHSDGKVTDVKIYSLNMYNQDIQLVAKMIQGLSYNKTLAFPKNTKREVVEVSALYVFDDTEQRTDSNDFDDVESYRYYAN